MFFMVFKCFNNFFKKLIKYNEFVALLYLYTAKCKASCQKIKIDNYISYTPYQVFISSDKLISSVNLIF